MASMTTEGLSRRFGKVTAVNALTLDLPEGGVVGLVGPNGSGKSTLIRMLLGLIRPTGGTATVLGSDIRHPSRYAGDVGALIESPAFVPALSARRNLTSLARLRGLPLTRVDEVLEIVGLAGRDTEPVKAFSLGMKQRLGIAAALLPDPRLLILDEPTNGLDPAGIVEIRALLRRLASEGRTVIVSSHLLAEIEAACDYIVVIRFGELMFTGPIEELMARTRAHIDLTAEHERDHGRLSAYLEGAGWQVQDVEGRLRVSAEQAAGAAINRAAAGIGITLESLTFAQDSLEDIFLAMTGETDGELAAHRAAAAVEAVA
jgi:ABC-2 type transport system ATP-binding protein